MAKPDWRELQKRFLSEHAISGISPKTWCEVQGLNYATARRHIKKPAAQSAQKTAQKKLRTAQKQEMRTAPNPEILERESQPDTEDNVPGEDEESITLPPELSCISPRQLIFAEHVARGKTRVEAYRLAGYTCDTNAYSVASRMYRNVKVARAIRYLRDKYQRRYTAEIDEIVHQLVSIARADPNDLSQHRRVNCRYCWGEHHLYQWRDIAEFDKSSAAAAMDGKKEPEYGGLGFVDTADPNPDCPKCCGEGIGQVFIPDTRDLDNDARWLYAGVKETKFGIEVQSSSQEAARRELLKYLSMMNRMLPGIDQTGSGPALDDEWKRLRNEKLRIEIENLKKGAGGGDNEVIIHNSLPMPGVDNVD